MKETELKVALREYAGSIMRKDDEDLVSACGLHLERVTQDFQADELSQSFRDSILETRKGNYSVGEILSGRQRVPCRNGLICMLCSSITIVSHCVLMRPRGGVHCSTGQHSHSVVMTKPRDAGGTKRHFVSRQVSDTMPCSTEGVSDCFTSLLVSTVSAGTSIGPPTGRRTHQTINHTHRDFDRSHSSR